MDIQNKPEKIGTIAAMVLLVIATVGGTPAVANSGSYVQSIDGSESLQEMNVRVESTWFATQGNGVVSQADLETALERIPSEHRSGFLISTERIEQMLSSLMLVRLLSQRAEAEGLLDDPNLRAKLFQATSVLLAEAYRDHYFAKHELDSYEQQARELYLTNPGRFKSPRTVTFTHILVGSGRERGETDAMRRVLEVYEQLDEGKDFEAVVAEYSDDPNRADNQGVYAEVEPSGFDEELESVVSILAPGQISEPVRSGRGWHIIRLDERHEPRQLEWEEAKDQAKAVARRRHQQQTLESLYSRLFDAPVKVAEDGLEKLYQRYGISGGPEYPNAQDIQDFERE